MRLRYLALIGWILLHLALVEVALETRAHLKGWDTLLYGPVLRVAAHDDIPGAGAGAFGPTEEFPFRSRVVDRDPVPGTERVWIASASQGEDAHLPPDRIFADVLATARTEAGRPTQVLNASRAGIGIAANTRTLRASGADWRPQVALLYQASIDVGRLAASAEDADDDPETSTTAPSGVRIVPWLQRGLESTTSYELLAGTVRAWLGSQRVLMDRLPDDAFVEYERLVREFVRAAREIGAQPVLATFATSHTEADLGSIPDEVVLGVFQFNDQLSIAGWLDAFDRCNAVVEAVALEEGLAVVPIDRALSGRPEYFRDLVHFSPKGHELVAATIRDALDASAASPVGRDAR